MSRFLQWLKADFMILVLGFELGLFAGYYPGIYCGKIEANRATLKNAIEIIDTLPVPVDNLNAQDVILIIARSSQPRNLRTENGMEEYAPGGWIRTSRSWRFDE